MSSIPLELITLLGSAILGSVMRLWGASIQVRRLMHLMSLQALVTKAAIINQARRYENPGFQWTRRIIALTAVFSIILLPKLVAIFLPSLPIHIGYHELSRGFLFFTSDVSKIQWIHLNGLTITPLDTHLLSAIIGLYFGGSLVGNR